MLIADRAHKNAEHCAPPGAAWGNAARMDVLKHLLETLRPVRIRAQARVLFGVLMLSPYAWAQDEVPSDGRQDVPAEWQQDTAGDASQQQDAKETRGITTQAAREANEQVLDPARLEPAQEQAAEALQQAPIIQPQAGVTQEPQTPASTVPEQAAEPAVAAPSEPAQPDGGVAVDVPAIKPPERAVLFKVTPPTPVVLPAESMRESSADVERGAASAVPTPVAAQPASYLLGTIHFGTPEEQGVDYEALEALSAQVDTFVNEADIDAAWKPEYESYRWLPVETPLAGMVGEDDIAMARALLPAVRTEDLDRMKPWAVLSLLEARGESDGDVTMDARLQRMAHGASKRLVHLETLEQQLQALDCVPASEHAQVLDERLRKSWILRIESAEAMAFYRSRSLDAWLANVDELDGLSEGARAVEQRARRCLLEERNARWIGQLQTLFQEGSCLVAVGAIHLVGPDGLIARLRRDGYQVDAMPF